MEKTTVSMHTAKSVVLAYALLAMLPPSVGVLTVTGGGGGGGIGLLASSVPGV